METQLPLPQRGTAPPIFGPYLLSQSGWMNQDMSLGREVGLGPNNIVLHGDPAPPPQKGGTAPSPIFGPCPLWPNGWMDQDATWCGGRPWPTPHCVTWGPSSPQNGQQTPLFSPCLLWPKLSAEHLLAYVMHFQWYLS